MDHTQRLTTRKGTRQTGFAHPTWTDDGDQPGLGQHVPEPFQLCPASYKLVDNRLFKRRRSHQGKRQPVAHAGHILNGNVAQRPTQRPHLNPQIAGTDGNTGPDLRREVSSGYRLPVRSPQRAQQVKCAITQRHRLTVAQQPAMDLIQHICSALTSAHALP
ncbi:hypothetical protein GCM10011317_34480 [Niveispirillum cyanobacteriorum]|nr:hypothetical protein GCM10011317_34480 [Niveispirillum cyanobacteriorum]